MFILFLVNSLICFASELDESEAVEFEVFKEQIFPFLRKNCVECHSENSIKPVGPAHSHSNVELAFIQFQKRFLIQNPTKSKFWRMGSDQHYCREHNFNCERSENISNEIKESLTNYVNAVKTEKNRRGILENPQGLKLDSAQHEIEIVFPSVTEQTNGNVKIVGRLLQMPSKTHYILKALVAVSANGIYHIKGVHFFINGERVKKQTGFESLDRYLIFGDFKSNRNHENILAPYQPILGINPEDRLSIQVDVIEEVDSVPSTLCHGKAFEFFKDNLSENLLATQMLNNAQSHSSPLKDLEICLRYESEVNKKSLRRSALLARNQEYTGADSMLASTVSQLSEWLSKQDDSVQEMEPFYFPEDIKKGRYLFKASGCANCHGSDLSGGIEFDLGQDGKLFSPNISPHKYKGIGSWSDEDFVQAVQKGVSPEKSSNEGSSYYPVFSI
ncbi:MAG: hypothetical protein KDD40_00745 [Bdellovibrionales bacterium]|nr:hypothetical protein [Bdellovibrionales bacterium]